jgi:hypothetical protein
MSNISVPKILKMYDKWIDASKLAALVAAKLKISERQACNLIEETCERKEILKVELPNRTAIIYGLTEFGPARAASRDPVVVE